MFLNRFWKAAVLSLIVLCSFFGCQKDKFDTIEQVYPTITSLPRFEISVSEARDFYHARAHTQTESFDGTDEKIFLRMEPDWALAYSSTSYNGKSMLVVPFQDRRLVTMNNGKVEGKLVFTKVSPDTLTASIVLYVSDNDYHTTKNGSYTFADFTGAYLFFNLDQQFKEGVFVKNGIPVGKLDTLIWTPKAGVGTGGEDRTINCITIQFDVDFCPEYVFSNCFQTYQFSHTYCWGSPGSGGNGGSGGTGGGSGGGGGGGGTGGTGGGQPTDVYVPPLTAWYTIFSGVPVDVFLQNGGVIPNTINVDIAQKLIAIHRSIKLTEAEIKWLTQFENQTQNQQYVDLLYNFLQLGQTGNDDNSVRLKHAEEVLKFFMTSGIPCTPARFNQMLNNADVFEGLQSFFNDYQGQENVSEVIQMMMDHAVANNLTDFDSADFANFGNTAFPCGQCFSTAIGAEYAILKYQHCTATPCSRWELAKLFGEATWRVIGDGVHLLLDGAGMVPVIGEVADLTNGVIYALEGDNVTAATSIAAAVPFIGWTATGAKYARKIINVAGNNVALVYIVRSADGLIQFGERGQLRTVLRTAANWQAHHIIPWEKSSHRLVQAAANVQGDNAFHLNELANGISLPMGFGVGNLPAHTGSHPAFTNRVEASLEATFEKYKDTNTGLIDPNLAANKLRELIDNIRAAIQQHGSCPTCSINDVSGWANP